MQNYKKLVDEFQERLSRLVLSSCEKGWVGSDMNTKAARLRISRFSHLLLASLRQVSRHMLRHIREILDDYQESLFALLLKYVKDLQRRQKIRKLCLDWGFGGEGEVRDLTDLQSWAEKLLLELESDVNACDEQIAELEHAMEDIRPVLDRQGLTVYCKGSFQNAYEGYQEMVMKMREERARAFYESCRIRNFQAALNLLDSPSTTNESNMEKALLSLWDSFYRDVSLLAEPDIMVVMREGSNH